MEFKHPERRKDQRRKMPDPRQLIRFEPEKMPRRSGKVRRVQDVWAIREKF